eukprot:TRINITY_DN8426_c0_g1_i2.p1 TRINITY_DN8426_c0_g1~~TRINITY_DN8426_c0_g1_i2.p1  ORF type:complete len:502 (+),score=49.02 TRINITY_DN8426_c0_g1_i2:183-1688(+)
MFQSKTLDNRILTATLLQETPNPEEVHKTYNQRSHALTRHIFTGTWASSNGGNTALKSSEGKTKLLFLNTTFAYVLLYDGRYADEDKYMIALGNISTDTNLTRMMVESNTVTVYQEKMMQLTLYRTGCSMTMSVNIAYNKLSTKVSENDIGLELSLASPDCNFAISGKLSLDPTDLLRKAINYTIMLVFVSLLKMYGIHSILHEISNNPSEASKYSVYTLILMLVWDAYFSIFHLFLSLNFTNLFHLFVLPFLILFILYSVFETKLLIEVWRYQNHSFETQPEEFRRKMISFYMKFYLFMFLWLIIISKLILVNAFLVINAFILAPQIYHLAQNSILTKFQTNLVFYSVVPTGLILAYFRGCPNNLLELSPSAWTVGSFFTIILVQILLLYLQTRRGPQFFIPASFLPPKFNYFIQRKNADLEQAMETDNDCAICMNSLRGDSGIDFDQTAPYMEMVLNVYAKENCYMRTPCNHCYHPKCLINWMAVKLECPTCRKELPPL